MAEIVCEYDYAAAQREFVRFHDLKVGDKVKILRTSTQGELGWQAGWHPDMNDRVGETLPMRRITPDGIVVIGNGASWKYPFFVLEKIKEKVTSPEIAEGLPTLIKEIKFLSGEISLLRREMKQHLLTFFNTLDRKKEEERNDS